MKIGPLSSPVGDFLYDTIRYDIPYKKFNVDSKAECDQLNLTHIARKIYKKTKTNKRQYAHLVQYGFKIREGSPEGIRKTMEERICERDVLKVKCRGNDRW